MFETRRRAASDVADRREDRDAQGLRRGARGRRRDRRQGRRARRGGLQLDLRRDLQGRPSGPLLRDVDRRAAARRGRRSGCRCAGWKPFASTFAAFFARAYDFVRMGAISQADIRLVGSHAGVSIGEDGPSQMALEDLAVVPRGARLDRPLPVRPEPDGPARRADGRHGRDRLHADDPRGAAGAVRAGRAVPRSAARTSCGPPTTTT